MHSVGRHSGKARGSSIDDLLGSNKRADNWNKMNTLLQRKNKSMRNILRRKNSPGGTDEDNLSSTSVRHSDYASNLVTNLEKISVDVEEGENRIHVPREIRLNNIELSLNIKEALALHKRNVTGMGVSEKFSETAPKKPGKCVPCMILPPNIKESEPDDKLPETSSDENSSKNGDSNMCKSKNRQSLDFAKLKDYKQDSTKSRSRWFLPTDDLSVSANDLELGSKKERASSPLTAASKISSDGGIRR